MIKDNKPPKKGGLFIKDKYMAIKDPEKRKEYDRLYRETHKEQKKKYREMHKEIAKKQHKQYEEAHKEKRKEQHKNYYENHKKEINFYIAERKNNISFFFLSAI